MPYVVLSAILQCVIACMAILEIQWFNVWSNKVFFIKYTNSLVNIFNRSSCISDAVVIRDDPHPCTPSPCGANAQCREQNNAGSCSCLPGYFGNPYEGCRPECIVNTDCSPSTACIQYKCQNPCPGNCGLNADCQVVYHVASCICNPGYTGNPYQSCNFITQQSKFVILFSFIKTQ